MSESLVILSIFALPIAMMILVISIIVLDIKSKKKEKEFKKTFDECIKQKGLEYTMNLFKGLDNFPMNNDIAICILKNAMK